MNDHAAAWDAFERYIAEARMRLVDGWAPVGLICLQARANEDGSTDLEAEKDGAIIWPAGFPVEARGPLLLRLSKPYFDRTVLRG